MARLDLGKVVPEKGVDYYTTTDKAEMVSETKTQVLEEITIPTKTSQLTNDSGFITNSVNDLTNYTLATNTGSTIELSINSSTYVMTLNLKNSAGTTISTGTIDLPLESVVVGGRYDDTTKKVILTLQNGNTVEFSVADLVAGLQSEITSENKLSSDLVDDTNHTNKFVTASDKTNWNAKVGFEDYPNLTLGRAGVIKVISSAGTTLNNGVLTATEFTYQNYQNLANTGFISKGTLENVITGKDLTTKAYVDGLVGDISSALDTINGESI